MKHVLFFVFAALFALLLFPLSFTSLEDFALSVRRFDMRLLVTVVVFSALVVVFFLTTIRNHRLTATLAEKKEEMARLRAALDQSELLLEAQEELWVVLDGNASVTKGALPDAAGVPRSVGEIIQFHSWVDPDMAYVLVDNLAELILQGQDFNKDIQSQTKVFLNITGRILGGHPVLRVRKLAGEEKNVSEISHALDILRDDHAALWHLLSILDQPVWIVDVALGRAHQVNKSYLESTCSDSSGEEIKNLLEPAEQERFLAEVADKKVVQGQFSGRDMGRVSRFLVSAIQFSGKVVCIGRNTSLVDNVYADMQAYVETCREILDLSPIAMAVFDDESQLAFCNTACATLWGIDKDFLVSKPYYAEILDIQRRHGSLPEQADYQTWRQRHLKAVSATEAEKQLWHLSNRRVLHFSSYPNRFGGFTLFYEDVTKVLSLESQNNAFETIQKETLDHLKEGIALFSCDGRLRLFNPVFAHMWSLAPEELDKAPHVDFVATLCCGKQILPVWALAKQSVTALEEARHESRNHFDIGHGRVADCAVVPLPGGSTLITFMDVTDAVRSESALRERNESLETTEKIRSAFVRHVSYVLRVPLNTIIGYTDLLTHDKSGTLTSKQREFADHILSSSHSLLAIINDILDLATLDAGAMELTYAPGDVKGIMLQAVEGLRDRLHQVGIEPKIIVGSDMAEFMVDGKRLKQILFNLLSNAISFSMPGGSIHLISMRYGDEVRISVIDTGRGIGEAYRASIFTPFESSPALSGPRGVGLGLSIVRGLVELHGGYVQVFSEIGKGTEVRCIFPISPYVARPVPPAPERSKEVKTLLNPPAAQNLARQDVGQ